MKQHKNSRKKGNVILLGLALLIAFLVIVGVYLNANMSWETYNRVQTAIEEGAKVRAQAVDMFLKENSGIIEAYHERNYPAGTYGMNGHPDIDHAAHLSVQGHVSPYLPNNEHYQAALLKADQNTKEAVLGILNYSLKGTTAGNDILMNFDKGNICIEVKPLPRTVTDGVMMDFSCTTPKGDTVEMKNVRVTPVEGSKGVYKEGMNRQMIFDPTPGAINSGDELIHEVVNVVFVGAVFEHRHFLEGLFPQMAGNINNIGKKKAASIAYPQVDKCFGSHCFNYE